MDLQEIINHRSHCLICGNRMKFELQSKTDLIIKDNDKGLIIRSNNNPTALMFFGFDGKYQMSKRNHSIYKHPLHIIKRCRKCKAASPKNQNRNEIISVVPQTYIPPIYSTTNIITKSRSLGATTMGVALNNFTNLNNMKSRECSYAFQIMGDAEGNYAGGMNHEDIKYHDADQFWHISNSYVMGASTLTHGRFDASLMDVMTLQIPALVNLNGLKTKEEFLSKFKMYMLMS